MDLTELIDDVKDILSKLQYKEITMSELEGRLEGVISEIEFINSKTQ